MKRLHRRSIVGALATAALFMALCASAQALPFELVPGAFKVESTHQDLSPDTQAGAHPFQMSTEFKVALEGEYPDNWVSGGMRDIITNLPPGLIGNPEAAPKCSRPVYSALAINGFSGEPCPAAAQVGLAYVVKRNPGEQLMFPVYLLDSPRGVTTSLGFIVTTVPVIINVTIDTAGDYGVEATSLRTSQGLPVSAVRLVLWGSPQAAAHDAVRYCGKPGFGQAPPQPCPIDGPEKPFMTNTTVCDPAPTSSLAIDSWEEQGAFRTASFTGPATTGCELLRFSPTFVAAGTSRSAGSASGLAVEIAMPQDEDPQTGLVPSAMRDAVVTLPKGVAINPVSAEGLDACADSRLGLGTRAQIACPDGSKLGTVIAETPLLDHPLQGDVYLRTQASTDPSSGEMFRLALVLDDPETGLIFKLPGQVRVDPATGQVTTSFVDNPPLPVSRISLSLKSGPRAPLTMPEACGTYPVEAELSPWSGNPPVHLTSTLTVDQGCDGKDRFTPGLQAGTANPIAGRHSPFTLRVTRPDGQQNVAAIEATLPEGVLAKLAGVTLCPDAVAASGACPQASQVGTATVGAGAGSNPIYVPQPGRPGTGVYLAGPYRGAPYSLVVKVPAQAGPFDLGTVVVRNAITVDPDSAQVSVKSDPLPQVVQGVPIEYRDVRVDVSRDGFTLNPTSCDPMKVTSALTSSGGLVSNPSDRFQVGGCERLRFKPKLAIGLSGQMRRSGNPVLKAVLKAPEGQANIAKTTVILPKSQFIDNSHINNPCTRVQFGEGACPAKSILGRATAYTPLLDEPLTGPVYFRSNGGERELPDLVADLHGQIHVTLVGFIDSVREKGGESSRVRTRFLNVPDAPVSKFILKMKGGKQGLLENSTNLCRSQQRVAVEMDGQNGKVHDFGLRVKRSCAS
jgi:hypothetical protein